MPPLVSSLAAPASGATAAGTLLRSVQRWLVASDDMKKKRLLQWRRVADAERARREGGPRSSETMLKRSAALLAEISPLPAPFLPAFPYGPLADAGPGRVGNVPAGASGRAETNRPE